MFSVIGHRGWPTRFPDNTLAGFSAAATVADAIETDIRRSSDGKLVLSHDPEIGGLPLGLNTWAELGEVDLGGGHHPVLLDECLASLPDFPVMLEVKNMPNQPGFEPDHRLGLEAASRARDGDMVTSFHWPTVDAVHRQFPELLTGLVIDAGAGLIDAIEHCLDVGHRLLAPSWSLLTGDTADDLVGTGLEIYVWTVNKPDLAQDLVGLGATGIITDDPGLIASARGGLMTIKEELATELRDAMRSQDKPRRDVIRQIETEVAVARSQPGFEGEADDELYRQVIGSYVKKMDKARGEYLEVGERGQAMADKLGYEVEYLSHWLPRKLDEASTRELVQSVIADLGVAGEEKAAGRVTGELMKARAADLDGGLVNRLVREELAAG